MEEDKIREKKLTNTSHKYISDNFYSSSMRDKGLQTQDEHNPKQQMELPNARLLLSGYQSHIAWEQG